VVVNEPPARPPPQTQTQRAPSQWPARGAKGFGVERGLLCLPRTNQVLCWLDMQGCLCSDGDLLGFFNWPARGRGGGSNGKQAGRPIGRTLVADFPTDQPAVKDMDGTSHPWLCVCVCLRCAELLTV
jgi:hypothetical protein